MPSQYHLPLPSGQTTAGCVGCVEPAASHAQPGPPDQDRPGRSATPERRGGEEPVGEAPCDLGEERQRGGGACLRPVLVAPLPVLVGGERSLPWRRRRRRRRLCLQREQRRMGDGRGGVDRVQVHRQPLRPAQPGGAVRSPLVLPEPPLDRSQRRQPAIAATSLAPVESAWVARAGNRHRASSPRAAGPRCGGCTPPASPPTRSGQGSGPATGSLAAACARHSPDRRPDGREGVLSRPRRSDRAAPSVAHPPEPSARLVLALAPHLVHARRHPKPIMLLVDEEDRLVADHMQIPRRGHQRMRDAATHARHPRRARDPSPPPRRERADPNGRGRPPPATRQPAPAAGRPGGSAPAGPQQNHASYPSVTPFSGLPYQPRHLSPPCR